MKNTPIKEISVGLGVFVLLAFSSPVLTHASMITHNLTVGDSGPDVATLQAFLAQDSVLYPQGLVTGYYGFLTEAAVSNFQARNGIAAIGSVGSSTLAIINLQMINGINPAVDTTIEIPTTYLSVHP